jgi:MFS family permease
MLLGGLLGDVIGRRRVLLGGALVSTVCGALAMVAPNVPWFAVTRSIDAFAGAMAIPFTLAVLRLTFPQRGSPGTPREPGHVGLAAAPSGPRPRRIVALKVRPS